MKATRRNTLYLHEVTFSSKGFTLIEVIVVMAIFMGIIIISSEAFNKIVSISSQQTKSVESDIQGVLGLEMMRLDLEHAGYGLPWGLSFTADFAEVPSTVADLAPPVDTQSFNDKALNSTVSAKDGRKLPRALQAAASTADGRDYLVIKSILAGISDASRKWSYVEGVGATSTLKSWGSNDFAEQERVVTVDSRTKRLIATDSTAANFSYEITSAMLGSTPGPPPAGFRPGSDTDVYVVYGVSDNSNLAAPYNRVDYYVKTPSAAADLPARCAPGTGILYKAVMTHPGGGFQVLPLVECVADMQVVFDLDGILYEVSNGNNNIANLTAKEIRQQLKGVHIYIVAHEGGKDTRFSYSKGKDLNVGEENGVVYGRTLDLEALVGSAGYKNYRWKTYKLVVNPKNINY